MDEIEEVIEMNNHVDDNMIIIVEFVQMSSLRF